MKIDLPELVLSVDDSLLVINKPAGLPTLPDGYDATLPHLKSVLEPDFGRLWLVHRLDKETSGVIVLARTAEAHRSLNIQFEQRRVAKLYHALASGQPEWQHKTVGLPLRVDGDRRHRTIVDPRHGKPAVTEFTILEQMNSFCLVEAAPRTGRTHQIRAHLAAVGLSILNDPLYQPVGQSPKPGMVEKSGEIDPAHFPLLRLALHARSITFQHPALAATVTIEAPYPDDFSAALAVLQNLA